MKTTFSLSNLLIVIALTLLTLTGCQGGIVGNGHVETRNEEVGNFSRLVVSGNFRVFLEPSSKPYLKMEMDENLYDIVKVKEVGNTLRIETEITIVQAREKSLHIGITDLDRLELNGAVRLSADSVIKTKDLNILTSGASKVNFEIETRRLDIDASGAVEFDLRGRADEFSIRMSGAGDVDALDLISKEVEIDISGAGGARVYARDKLDVSVSGLGSVRYRGEPEIHRNISGLGSLKRD